MTINQNVIEIKNVSMIYNHGKESEIAALSHVNTHIKKGEFVLIMGPSGSGKTTLLDVIGCLLRPTTGEIFIDGIKTSDLSESELAKLRGEKLGFIFQQYNLIPSFTALENVAYSLRINGEPKSLAIKRAKEILDTVGLGKRLDHKPSELSGGEQQRVAIARSLANDPEIILGDEPTGNLDTKTGNKILKMLKDLNKLKGYTILLVTHDPTVGDYTDKIIHIKDGKIEKVE